MKALIKIPLLLILIISLYSCATGVPIAMVSAANNKTYQVDYLFEHDGCKVYRFYDHGEYVYFTNCTGEVTTMKRDSTDARVINVVKSNGY